MGLLGTLGGLAGSFLGPVGSTVGGALGSYFDSSTATNQQNDYNAQQAQANRDFQERMSSTSYQRGVKDMEAAGLNPMLAYSQGGASTPSGATSAPSANRVQVQAQSQQADAQSALATAQVANTQADTDNKKASSELIAAQAAAQWASADSTHLNMSLIGSNIKKVQQETENLSSENDKIKATIQVLGNEAELLRQKGMSEQQIQENMRATLSKIQADTKLVGFDISAASSLDNLGRTAGQAKPLADLLSAILHLRSK